MARAVSSAFWAEEVVPPRPPGTHPQWCPSYLVFGLGGTTSSAQKAELTVLAKALDLGAGKKINIYTDLLAIMSW